MPRRKRKSHAQRCKERRDIMRNRRKREAETSDVIYVTNNKRHDDSPILSMVCGTISQADETFRNGGLQCTGICLEALRHNIIKPMSDWIPGDIDDVIRTGDDLYNSIVQNTPRMLRVNELPLYFERDETIYHLNIYDQCAKLGFLRPGDNMLPSFCSVEDALRSTFTEASSVFFIFRNTTILLISIDENYYLFDSHPRTSRGLMTSSLDGKAIVACFDSMSDLLTYFNAFFVSAHIQDEECFEATPVSLQIADNVPYHLSNSEEEYDDDQQDDDESDGNGNVERCHAENENNAVNKQKHNRKSRERNRIKRLYHSNPTLRERKLNRARSTYHDNCAVNQRVKERLRKRYHSESPFREKKIADFKEKYHSSETFKAKQNKTMKQRYHDHPNVKAKAVGDVLKRYHSDTNIKANYIENAKKRYHSNPSVRKSSIERVKLNYRQLPNVKRKLIERHKKRYHSNERNKIIQGVKERYHSDPDARARTIQQAKLRRLNAKRECSNGGQKQSYKRRKHVHSPQTDKAHGGSDHPDQDQREMAMTGPDNAAVKSNFDKVVREGPDYVCSSCMRLRFRKQVTVCLKDKYISTQLANRSISEQFVHKCDDDCNEPCPIKEGPRGKLYICETCDRHLKNGDLPPECHANGLELDDIPADLIKLNTLERHLLSLRIPFMKVMQLPKGGQKSITGPITCVPSNINHTRETLPRAIHDSEIVMVALKRKLEYKGNYARQLVDLTLMERCLHILKTGNKHYANVKIENLTYVPEDEEGQQRQPYLYEDVYLSHVDTETEPRNESKNCQTGMKNLQSVTYTRFEDNMAKSTSEGAEFVRVSHAVPKWTDLPEEDKEDQQIQRYVYEDACNASGSMPQKNENKTFQTDTENPRLQDDTTDSVSEDTEFIRDSNEVLSRYKVR